MTGMFPDIFNHIQDMLNFTYSVRPPADEEWGVIKEDGKTWTGMVGDLAANSIDIAVTDFTVTAERNAAITFGEPITQIYNSFFVKNPTNSNNFTAYLDPLNFISWVAIIMVILCAPPILFLTTRHGGLDPKHDEFTLAKSYIFTAGTMASRPWSTMPETWKARIVFYSLLLGGTMLFWHWEAMLISYLATRITVLPFKTMSELMLTSYKIGIDPGSYYVDYFQTSPDPLWRKAYHTKVVPFLDSYKDVMNDDTKFDIIMEDSEVAFYENYFVIASSPEFINCQIIAVPGKYDVKPFAFGFQKHSPYIRIFNHFIFALWEKGTLDNILNNYLAEKQVCPDFSGKSLGLESCFTAFGILTVGMAICTFLIAFELIMKYFGCDLSWLPSYGNQDRYNQTIHTEYLTTFQINTVIFELKREIERRCGIKHP